jgi:hypothetical protein
MDYTPFTDLEKLLLKRFTSGWQFETENSNIQEDIKNYTWEKETLENYNGFKFKKLFKSAENKVSKNEREEKEWLYFCLRTDKWLDVYRADDLPTNSDNQPQSYPAEQIFYVYMSWWVAKELLRYTDSKFIKSVDNTEVIINYLKTLKANITL